MAAFRKTTKKQPILDLQHKEVHVYRKIDYTYSELLKFKPFANGVKTSSR